MMSMHGDDFSYIQEDVLTAFGKAKRALEFNDEKSLVVAVYDERCVLQHYMVLHGHASAVNEDLLRRKAQVVWRSGLSVPRALERSDELGVALLADWLPLGEGTTFHGAAPAYLNEQLKWIVAVSGQDHLLVDQPFAEMVVTELEKRPIISVG